MRAWVFVLVACVALLGAPSAAGAWPGASEPAVVLGFGASYAKDDGAMVTHSGCDVALAPGSLVEAPACGVVTFVGQVPSAAGGTQLACTLQLAEDVSVTLMPFADADVSRGDAVGRGDPLGSIAETGDPSSPVAHVHVGMRRGGLYVDPAPLLAAPAASVDPEPDGQPDASTGCESDPAPVTPPMSAPEPAPLSAPSAVTQTAEKAVSAPRGTLAGQSAAGGSLQAASAGVCDGSTAAPPVDAGGVVLSDGSRVRAASAENATAPQPHAARAGRAPGAAAVSRTARGRLPVGLGTVVGSLWQAAGFVAVAALLGVALLWPLWRPRTVGRSREGSPVGERVATAAAR